MGPFGSIEWYRNYSAVTAACMMIPSQVFREVGGFNEDYQLAFGDVELCLRIIEHGYRVVYAPFAWLIHHESVTRGRYIPTDDLVTGFSDFMPYLAKGDPYFNPNLSYSSLYPTIGRGPEDRIQKLKQIVARILAVEGKTDIRTG